MEGLLKYNYSDPDATGVAHDNIDSILAGNRAEEARRIGTIGPTPWGETEEGQQSLMDMAMGSAFPGAAVGRVAKGAVTGGEALLPKAMKQFKQTFGKQRSDKDIRNVIKDYFDQMMGKAKASKTMDEGMDYLKKKKAMDYFKSKVPKDALKHRNVTGKPKNQYDDAGNILGQHAWDKRLNLARIERGKLFDKSGIPHEQAVNDPITEILRALKYRKN